MPATARKIEPPWNGAEPDRGADAPASTLAVLGAALHEPLTAVGASRTLASLGECAVPVLVRALRCGEAWTRELAAETLGETGATTAWNPLLRALRDPEETVRVAAACAIEQLGRTPERWTTGSGRTTPSLRRLRLSA